MFRRQISPKTAAIALVVILAVVQAVYWRLLVYRESGPFPGGGGGGAAFTMVQEALGFESVQVETLAGEAPGYRDGRAWDARFSGPNALAVAPDGALYVADSRNHRIRRITRDGDVTTVAGGAEPGGPGGRSEGPASGAGLRYPSGVAISPEGTLYISDTGNHRICRVRDGQLRTLAGGGEGKADGPGAAARFRFPAALAWGPDGALWVADQGNGAVRRVELSGRVTTPAAVPGAVRDALGDVGAPTAKRPLLGTQDGQGTPGPVPFFIGRRSPGAIRGPMRFFADPEYHVMLAASAGEVPFLLAGRRVEGTANSGTLDGQGHRTYFAAPCAVAVGAEGELYVADYEGNRIRRLRLPGWVLEGAAAPERPEGRRLWRRESGS